jgi:transposase-like protein
MKNKRTPFWLRRDAIAEVVARYASADGGRGAISAVARDIGVSPETVRTWYKEYLRSIKRLE